MHGLRLSLRVEVRFVSKEKREHETWRQCSSYRLASCRLWCTVVSCTEENVTSIFAGTRETPQDGPTLRRCVTVPLSYLYVQQYLAVSHGGKDSEVVGNNSMCDVITWPSWGGGWQVRERRQVLFLEPWKQRLSSYRCRPDCLGTAAIPVLWLDSGSIRLLDATFGLILDIVYMFARTFLVHATKTLPQG